MHSAVVGPLQCRHGQVVPLELYLMEGIPLVMYLRDGPQAEMVELCEQSSHLFVTFGNLARQPPSFKVQICQRLHVVCAGFSCPLQCNESWEGLSNVVVPEGC